MNRWESDHWDLVDQQNEGVVVHLLVPCPFHYVWMQSPIHISVAAHHTAAQSYSLEWK